MSFYNANGELDDNGRFQLINGKLCLRDGVPIGFDMAFMDSAPASRTFQDAKAAEPASIDEAVALAFKNAAGGSGGSTDVAGWLAKLDPKELDRIVTQAAIAFVLGHAGGGIAKHFSTDSALDAELTYRLTAARAKHDLGQASKPAGQRTPFTADAAAAVVAKTVATNITITTDSASEVERSRSEYRGALAASKYLTSNAWRS